MIPYKVLRSADKEHPWIAMVHGVSQNQRLFNQQIAVFQEFYNLILIDLPGHGSASEMPGPFGMAEFAEHIEKCLIHANVHSCNFWGTHLGASAGLILATKKPEIFQSLVLEGPVYPGRVIPAVADLLSRVSSAAQTKGMNAARNLWWNEGPWFDVMRQNPDLCRAHEQLEMIGDFTGEPWLDSGLVTRPLPPIDERLKSLNLPTLIMNGEHDMIEFFAVADTLERQLPNASRAIITNGGGFPLWEYPDPVNEIVAEFLSRQGK